MITYTMLKNITEFSRSVPRPPKVAQTGYYPKTMKITKSGGYYTLSLEDMEYRIAE